MSYQYLVTTDAKRLEGLDFIVMVDGTVPGWTPKDYDLHFDHHRKYGADIQIHEIPGTVRIDADALFVTTQVDADACAAAAWLQLLKMNLDPAVQQDAFVALSAIAYDCDHLGLPESSEWDSRRNFAQKAVAALKETGGKLIQELNLSVNRKEWTEEQKVKYASLAFQRGTEWLVAACLGERDFPGENNEADSYLARMDEMRSRVYEKCFLYKGCTVFDQTSFDVYVDPRLAVEWARKNGAENITITIRSGARLPNASKTVDEALGNGCEHIEMFSYTLGSVPLHKDGSPEFSNALVWEMLADLEAKVREAMGIAAPETAWGGRNEVGGSSWRDPALATYGQVLDAVIDRLKLYKLN